MLKKGLFIALSVFFLMHSAVFALSTSEILKQKISTNFVNTSLERVVRVLSNQYGLNIIIGGNATGKVTIQLTNVTLSDALNAILKTQGYHYIVGNNVLFVKPVKEDVNGELTTDVFKLKYLDGFSLKEALVPMLSAKGKMEALLSENSENDKEKRSNILVVSDFWENVERITEAIKIMDVPAKALQIEVRLVEKLVGREDRVGLDLPTSMTVKTMGAETTAPITKSQSGGSNQAPTILSAWYELPNTLDNLSLGVLTFNELKLTLELLASDANSNLISRPSVTTLDNKKATIKIGQIIPVPEVSRGISGDLISYKEKEVSMTLEVIPHIGLNDDITLEVHPVLEEIIGYTGTSDAPQPITSKREVKSTVLVKDGETLVIGGLMKEAETENISKLWLLGDIPYLGRLFSHTTLKKEKTDLIIFITTKIFDRTKTAKASKK